MTLEQIRVDRELHTCTNGVEGAFYMGDTPAILESLLPEYEGKIKSIYMDPPFMTGDRFFMRVRVGANDWRNRKGSLSLESFVDQDGREQFLALMKRVLVLSRKLLSDDGMIFVHIDFRTHPYVRLLMDEIFGEDNFLNEIIWVYQSGGRSLRYFSRKHDVILFYRKSARYDFNVKEVMAPPSEPRSNHMRKHVDPDGRVYRSIRSNGRVYTYYDDDPVAPSDVWQDLSHLQQKDPERTGYDTQKPLALLERIVKCSSREGDIVLDPFAGSSTTLEAAKRNGRRFIGVDRCPMTANIARRRLFGSNYVLRHDANASVPDALCKATVIPGVGFYHVTLEAFVPEEITMPEGKLPMDVIDNWSVGYLRDGVYECMAEFVRTRRQPELKNTLDVPVYAGELVMCVNDVMGRSFYYRLGTM
ncbi:MAG: site-specific DNA-methyltransferase [Clostridiales bacterium]|nr:site-specific DNA-methyltransferase [Clostridiales bacterium]